MNRLDHIGLYPRTELRLELLMQFPASNDKNMFIYEKYIISPNLTPLIN